MRAQSKVAQSSKVCSKNILLPENERLWNTNGGIHYTRRYLTGVVRTFHWHRRGGSWGFIEADDGSGRALIIESSFKGFSFTTLSTGDDVSYVERDGPGGKLVVRLIGRVKPLIDGGGIYE